MDDLDRALARLAGAPAPAALDGMEARVLARIDRKPTANRPLLGMAIVTIAALAIGMVGADVPATVNGGSLLAPLGGGSPLAPSTLLVGE